MLKGLKNNKLIGNVASLGIIQIVNYVFPLITVPYISRIIGPDGYGIINYATAFIAYFTLIIAYGFDLTATRKISHNTENLKLINNVISEVITSRIVLFFLSLIFFIISLAIFKPIQKDIYVAIILFVGCISTVVSPQYIFQGFQELKIFAILNFFKGILNTALVFLLIKKQSDYYWIPTLTTFFSIAISIYLYYYSKKKFNVKYKLVSIKTAIDIIVSEKTIFFSTVVISLYTTTNTVILGFFADTREVGYYTTSQSFLNIVSTIITVPLSNALYPFVGKAFSESKERGMDVIKKITPIVSYITFAASLSILFLSPFLIKLVYGHKFDASVPALQIISFLPFIIGISNILGIQLMLNLGLDKLFFKTTFIASIIGFVLNFFMSKYYGYIGTAWNCIIIEVIVTLLMYILLLKKGINIFERKYFNPKEILMLLQNIRKN